MLTADENDGHFRKWFCRNRCWLLTKMMATAIYGCSTCWRVVKAMVDATWKLFYIYGCSTCWRVVKAMVDATWKFYTQDVDKILASCCLIGLTWKNSDCAQDLSEYYRKMYKIEIWKIQIVPRICLKIILGFYFENYTDCAQDWICKFCPGSSNENKTLLRSLYILVHSFSED